MALKSSSRRLSKEETEKRLRESLVYNDNINTKDLNEWAHMVENCEEAINIMKECQDIIKRNKKNINFFA